jgi:16S rRNA (uracil1498-N3)-methyltransferase
VHWFYDPDFNASMTSLSASESQHAKALRIRVGEQITITNGQGLVSEVLITSLDPIAFDVQSTSSQTRPVPRFHLYQALAKNDRDEMALQASVELGASSVTPWQAERSIVRWDQKAVRNQERWQTIAIEAMKQSQQAFLCEVNPLAATKNIKLRGFGIVLDPRAELALDQIELSEDITLVVGPEGGVSDFELETLKGLGFIGVRLGSSVLRASTAGPAAIAALQVLHGAFRS